MGQIVGKIKHAHVNVSDAITRRRKRKHSTGFSGSENETEQQEDLPLKKTKLLTTAQYVYKALFKDEYNSDIAVMALNKIWRLHKVYLSQSPYFYTMFNGSWKEAKEDFVHIEILDERITVDALDSVFGSLYSDEIQIDSKTVVSLLATATLFHLEGIIQKCAEIMVDIVNIENAVEYYEVACQYGLLSVKKSAFKWLELNVLSVYIKYPNLLRQIPIKLMTKLTESKDLYVLQTEFSLYNLLRTWIFLRLNPNYNPEDPEDAKREQDTKQRLLKSGEDLDPTEDAIQWSFYTSRKGACSFLATPEGQIYVPAFQKLRTQYLTNHFTDLKIVFNDNIIPRDWLYRHIYGHWSGLLQIDHAHDEGPGEVNVEDFNNYAMRCGRVLIEPGFQKWRWTGFNFGLDLVFILEARRITVRRNIRHEHERVLTLQAKRKFMIRVEVTSINAQRQPVHTQSTEILSLNLDKNADCELMILDAQLVHPLLISVNILVVPPTKLGYKSFIFSIDEYAANVAAATPIFDIGTNSIRTSTPAEANDSGVCIRDTLLATPENIDCHLDSNRNATLSVCGIENAAGQ